MTDRDATDEEVRAWLAVRRAGASRDEVPVLDRIEARLDAADWDHDDCLDDDCLDEPRAWPPPPPTAEAIKAERASIIAALDQSGPPATLVDDGTGSPGAQSMRRAIGPSEVQTSSTRRDGRAATKRVSTPGVSLCSGWPGVLECSCRKFFRSSIGRS
mgnify:CR=1 FL=1